MFIFFFQIFIHLQASDRFIALSEIELYVREDPTSTVMTPYSGEKYATYILPEGTNTNFEFDKVISVPVCYN
jgi:hypothetical protein